jgi:hypothetical protein
MKRLLPILVLLAASVQPGVAAEISHHAGGMTNIRDFMLPPDSGFYASLYNFYYQSGRLNDQNGRETTTRVTDPDSGAKFDVYPDVDVYMLSMPLAWVEKDVFCDPDEEGFLCDRDYGFLISPTFANNSVSTSLTAEGEGRSPETSQFDFGDLYVQPLWLGSSRGDGLLAYSLSWGFYAPTGRYKTAVYPNGERHASPKNTGFGFWTNEFRGTVQVNPLVEFLRKRNIQDGGPAFILGLSYDVNSEKEDFDVTPGDSLSLNWGISTFLPVAWVIKNNLWGFEFGPIGYDTWQVSSDSGSERDNGLHDEVHAAGFQIGLTHSKKYHSFNFRYLNEFSAESRFQGHVIGLSISLHLPGSLQDDYTPPPADGPE